MLLVKEIVSDLIRFIRYWNLRNFIILASYILGGRLGLPILGPGSISAYRGRQTWGQINDYSLLTAREQLLNLATISNVSVDITS